MSRCKSWKDVAVLDIEANLGKGEVQVLCVKKIRPGLKVYHYYNIEKIEGDEICNSNNSLINANVTI